MKVEEFATNIANGQDLILIKCLEKAFIGITHVDGRPRAVYCTEKVFSVLTKDKDMSEEEALRYSTQLFSTNMGHATPLFLEPYE